jgi:hypothetical protein
MHFESVYDIQQAGCRYGFLPIVFTALAVCAAFAWYRGIRWTVAGGSTQRGYSPRSACMFFAAVALLAFVSTWGECFSLTRALRAGRATTVEGVVTEFHPAATIKGYESFTVGGRAFSYCKYCTRQGFNVLRLEGSPIANGIDVQIIYIDDHILKLGIRR